MNLVEELQRRLLRKTQVMPSRWAEQCMEMGEPFPGPLSYKYHPWTREMINSEAPINAGMKAAQVGYSVTVLARTLYLIDIRKESVLYLLPTKIPDATDFSTTRFDPLLESSPHLQTMFSDVRNVGTKRAGMASLYIRGCNSRSGLRSIPVSAVMFDELDEMNADNVPLARQRTAGQRHSLEWYVSTPTVPGFGIDEIFQRSNKQAYFFPCPACSRRIQLVFDNLIIPEDKPGAAYLKCLECDAALTVPGETQDQVTERKASWFVGAEWVPENTSDICGWSINQAYSCAVGGYPANLADGYFDSMTSKAREQEYWTNRWGVAHEVEGARISDDLIISLAGKYTNQAHANSDQLITMGVDVGAKLHIIVTRWIPDKNARTNDRNQAARAEILFEGTRPTQAGFHELDEFMRAYNVRYCVIDANPERSSAAAFAKRFWGWVSICFYGNNACELNNNEDQRKVTVDRTQWMDQALGRFSAGTIALPRDMSVEFRKNLVAPVRVYKEDQHGNPVGRYVNNTPDHFAHALTYSEIALAVMPLT